MSRVGGCGGEGEESEREGRSRGEGGKRTILPSWTATASLSTRVTTTAWDRVAVFDHVNDVYHVNHVNHVRELCESLKSRESLESRDSRS